MADTAAWSVDNGPLPVGDNQLAVDIGRVSIDNRLSSMDIRRLSVDMNLWSIDVSPLSADNRQWSMDISLMSTDASLLSTAFCQLYPSGAGVSKRQDEGRRTRERRISSS